MNFSTLTTVTKRALCLLLFGLCLCLVLVSPGTASAGNVQKTYTVTEQELQTLENNLQKLAQISVTQQQESKRLQDTLIKSEQELNLLKSQLVISQEQLQQAQNSLSSANQLLQGYAAEAKRTRKRIKAQRNFWIAVAVTTLAVCIAK